MTALLELKDIRRSYPSGDGPVEVLKGISLRVEAGEMVAIVGASGSGKSTLMNILGCLDKPTSGTYRVAGTDVSTLDGDALAKLRREHFGFIFQRYHLLSHLNAAQNVEVPAVYAGVERKKRLERAQMLLTRLGLAPALLLLMAYFLPVDDYIKRVIIIQAAIPSAVIPVILAKRFGGHPDLGTQILLTTTVASFLTLPCWLALGSSLVVPLY